MKRVDTISVSHLKHIDYRGSAKPYNTTEKRTRLDDVHLVRTALIFEILPISVISTTKALYFKFQRWNCLFSYKSRKF